MSPEHTLRVLYHKDSGEITFYQYMHAWFPWYKKIWTMIKYIFGYYHGYGHYDCTLLKLRDYNKMKKLLDKSEKEQQK